MSTLFKSFIAVLLVSFSLSAKSQTNTPPRPYSPYRISAGTVYLSGQIAPPKAGTSTNPSGFDTEVAEVMNNISTILKTAGSDLSNVINVVVYLKDINQYAAFNKVYVTYFKAPLPARSCVAVKDLAAGANVEIAVIAELNKK